MSHFPVLSVPAVFKVIRAARHESAERCRNHQIDNPVYLACRRIVAHGGVAHHKAEDDGIDSRMELCGAVSSEENHDRLDVLSDVYSGLREQVYEFPRVENIQDVRADIRNDAHRPVVQVVVGLAHKDKQERKAHALEQDGAHRYVLEFLERREQPVHSRRGKEDFRRADDKERPVRAEFRHEEHCGDEQQECRRRGNQVQAEDVAAEGVEPCLVIADFCGLPRGIGAYAKLRNQHKVFDDGIDEVDFPDSVRHENPRGVGKCDKRKRKICQRLDKVEGRVFLEGLNCHEIQYTVLYKKGKYG